MTKPFPKMKTVPYGEDYMIPMFLGLVMYAIKNPEIRARFKAETGHDVDMLTKGSPIEQAIDKATGLQETVLMGFVDWVTINMWGTESA